MSLRQTLDACKATSRTGSRIAPEALAAAGLRAA